MTTFVTKYTNLVKQIQNQNGITGVFDKTKVFYAKGGGAQKKETRATARTGAKAGEECGYTVIAHTDSKVCNIVCISYM